MRSSNFCACSVVLKQLGELGDGRLSASGRDVDRRMDDGDAEQLRDLHGRDDVLEQQVAIHGLNPGELEGLVVDHHHDGVLRGEQVVTDRVAEREAGHQGCTWAP
jgi:hypothetical protein